MDFKQLESFVMIAKLKSFSRAAEKLYLTQPTISNHIHLLEKELGTVLFNRTNKQISLTQAGEIFYEHAISILNKKEHAFFSLEEYKGKIEGILEIASSSIPEQYYLADALRRFSLIYPDVRYNLMKHDTSQVIEKILSGEIDFGIVGAKPESAQLDCIEIMEDEIVLAGPTDGVDAIKTELIPDMPLILREQGSGTRSAAMRFLKEHAGLDPETLKIIAEVESNETIKRMVELGMGYSFFSLQSIQKELSERRLKLIPYKDAKISRSFYFVFHKKRVLSPLSDTFKSFINEDKLNKPL
jgi:LysR family transcriptional regulator, transcriptional activator of the cysJI operon